MRIKDKVKRYIDGFITDTAGASLVTTFVLLFIMIVGVSGVLYSTMYSYKYSNRSVDFNEMYYDLDGHAQEIVEMIDDELEAVETFVIGYMQSERYAKSTSYLEELDKDTHTFFHNRWDTAVFKKSKLSSPINSEDTSYMNLVDPVKYNTYLNAYYNEAFERLYFNRLYQKKAIFSNIVNDYLANLTVNDRMRFDMKLDVDIKKGKDYGNMYPGASWNSFDPKGDEVRFLVTVTDKDEGRELEAEILVNVPKYDPIEQDMAIPVRGNPLTSYAIITSGHILNKNNANTNVVGDLFAYDGLRLDSSQLTQHGNFYTHEDIQMTNAAGRSHYKVMPYGSLYDNFFRKGLYFGQGSTGQAVYINNQQLENNYNITMHTELWSFFDAFIARDDNPASLIFKDSLGGNVYCNDLITDERNADDPNILMEGGAIAMVLDHAGDKIDSKIDVYVDDPLKKIDIYHDYINSRAFTIKPLGGYYTYFHTFVYKYYIESKMKNGGIDMKTKHKTLNQIDPWQTLADFNSFYAFIDKKCSNELGNTGLTYTDEDTYEITLSDGATKKGIFYCAGDLVLKGNGTIRGAVIAEGDVKIYGNVNIIHDPEVIMEVYGTSDKVSEFFRKGEIGDPIGSTTVKADNARARVAVNEERYSVQKWILK